MATGMAAGAVRFTRGGAVVWTRSLVTVGWWKLLTGCGGWEVGWEVGEVDGAVVVTRELGARWSVREVLGNVPVWLPPGAVTVRWSRVGAPSFAVVGMRTRGVWFRVDPEWRLGEGLGGVPGRGRAEPGHVPAGVGEVGVASPVILEPVPPAAPVQNTVIVEPLPRMRVEANPPARNLNLKATERSWPFELPHGAAVTWHHPPGVTPPDGAKLASVRLANGMSVDVYHLDRAEDAVNAAMALLRRRTR